LPAFRHLPIVVVLSCALFAPARASTPAAVPEHFVDDVLIPGLDRPIDFAFLPDGRVLIAEQRSGKVRIHPDVAPPAVIHTVTDLNLAGDERGLLALAVDPEWPQRPYVYLLYTQAAQHLRVVRMRGDGDLTQSSSARLTLGDPYIVLDAASDQAPNHNGGALHFGRDSCLYVSIGDDDIPCSAQDSTSLRGAILRLWVRDLPAGAGGPPSFDALARADHPLVTPNRTAQLVYAYGLRNPFRFHIDPQTGALYVADVGDQTWEEFDEVLPGANLGWPLREGYAVNNLGSYCPEPGGTGTGAYDPPIAVLGNSGSAIMSAGIYRPVPGGTANWPVEYHGSAFYSEYYSGILRRLVRQGGSWSPAPFALGQPDPLDWGLGFDTAVQFRVGADGSMYWLQQFDATYLAFSGAFHRISYRGPATAVADLAGGPRALIAAPNPFRGRVELSFRCASAERVRLSIHDLAGREVRVLMQGEVSGTTRAGWDGRDVAGRNLAPGLYVARLERSGGPPAAVRIVLGE
jgi:glucose/arabinose dehydrogenase